MDCNRGSSAWQFSAAAADSGSLTFGPIALTRMFCPQPSSDTVVAAALGRVRSYLIRDGKLHLSLEADGGIMHWQPRRPTRAVPPGRAAAVLRAVPAADPMNRQLLALPDREC